MKCVHILTKSFEFQRKLHNFKSNFASAIFFYESLQGFKKLFLASTLWFNKGLIHERKNQTRIFFAPYCPFKNKNYPKIFISDLSYSSSQKCFRKKPKKKNFPLQSKPFRDVKVQVLFLSTSHYPDQFPECDISRCLFFIKYESGLKGQQHEIFKLIFFSHKSVVPGPLIHILKYLCHLLLFL